MTNYVLLKGENTERKTWKTMQSNILAFKHPTLLNVASYVFREIDPLTRFPSRLILTHLNEIYYLVSSSLCLITY